MRRLSDKEFQTMGPCSELLVEFPNFVSSSIFCAALVMQNLVCSEILENETINSPIFVMLAGLKKGLL